MNRDNNIITRLIDNFVTNQASKEDKTKLFEWLSEDSELIQQTQLEAESNQSIKENNKLRKEAMSIIDSTKYKKRALLRAERFNLRRVAAVASIVLVCLFSFKVYDKIAKGNVEYYIEESGVGEIREVTLADGTSVVLNSESKLTIPSNYNDEFRRVKLDGEAFFDVTPNKAKPFVIKSGKAAVRVLGTSFNLKSYKEDSDFQLAVASGKVALNYNKSELSMLLTKDQYVKIDKATGDFKKSTSVIDPSKQWRDGVLMFDQSPIEEVVKELNRKYKNGVRLENIDKEYVISGMHDNSDLRSVVESICHITSLKYRYDGETIVLYSR